MLELRILRLQVQLGPVKSGRVPWRVYDPAVLHQVAELAVTADGCIGVEEDGTEHLDVHHRNHPATRDRKGLAGISIMATGDYQALRERYGQHLIDGIAGESVLVEYAPGLAGRVIPASITVRPGRHSGNGDGAREAGARGGVVTATTTATGVRGRPAEPEARTCY